MKYNGIEHFDRFEDEVIFWVDITDVPQAIQDKAKSMDGENYTAECFGMCVCYDSENQNFDVVTDTDLSTGDSRNIYYIDNKGDKNWFQADMPQTFVHEVFAACNRANMEFEALHGFEIKDSVLVSENGGIILAEKPADETPFATWRFTEDEKGRQFYDGHYHCDRAVAEKDFAARVADLKLRYGTRESKRSITEQLKQLQKQNQNAEDLGNSPKKGTPNRERETR